MLVSRTDIPFKKRYRYFDEYKINKKDQSVHISRMTCTLTWQLSFILACDDEVLTPQMKLQAKAVLRSLLSSMKYSPYVSKEDADGLIAVLSYYNNVTDCDHYDSGESANEKGSAKEPPKKMKLKWRRQYNSGQNEENDEKEADSANKIQNFFLPEFIKSKLDLRPKQNRPKFTKKLSVTNAADSESTTAVTTNTSNLNSVIPLTTNCDTHAQSRFVNSHKIVCNRRRPVGRPRRTVIKCNKVNTTIGSSESATAAATTTATTPLNNVPSSSDSARCNDNTANNRTNDGTISEELSCSAADRSTIGLALRKPQRQGRGMIYKKYIEDSIKGKKKDKTEDDTTNTNVENLQQQKTELNCAAEHTLVPRKRGRPKGSKNNVTNSLPSSTSDSTEANLKFCDGCENHSLYRNGSDNGLFCSKCNGLINYNNTSKKRRKE